MNNQDSDKKKSQHSSEKVKVDGNVADSFIVTGGGNTFNFGSKKESQKPSKRKPLAKKPRKTNPVIVVAWIGLLATVLAALISLFGDVAEHLPLNGIAGDASAETLTLMPSATETNTATAITPTWTPTATSTETPSPVPTQTPVPPVALGEDWIKGCISTLWVAHPSSVQPVDREDGCWREPV